MEEKQLTPMMKQYMEVKNKYQDMIVFYRLGDFYEMFFDDALVASQILEIALTGRNAGLAERIPMCGVPYHASEAYIKKLIESGHKVAICEQLEDAATTKGIVKRDVVKIITPGTNFSEEQNYNYLMYIDDSAYSYYYLSLCDVNTGKLKALKIKKETKLLYNEIKNFQIKEVVLPQSFNTSIFNDLLKNYKLLLSFTPLIDDYNHAMLTHIEDDFKISFKALLAYIEAMQMSKMDYFMEVTYLSNDLMKLDFSSKFNLELTSSIKNNDKYGTLFWYLDKTKTAMGSRLLKEYIENPLVNKNMIINRQLFIEGLLDDPLNTASITNHLKSVYDIARLAAKIGLQSISPKELLWLSNSLKQALLIKEELKEYDNDIIKDFISNLNPLINLEVLISKQINYAILEGNNQEIINTGVNDLLDQYRITLEESSKWLINFEGRQRELTQIKNLKVKYNKVFGYYIEVSNGNKHLVKDEFNYIRKQTLTNAERYINSELKEQESLILNAQENVSKLELQLFNEFKASLGIYVKDLQKLAMDLAYLDVIISLSSISAQYGMCKPVFNEQRVLDIKDSFHPLIKSINQEQSFIENDFLINDEQRTIIITGPNMGGKSTYMRQLALIVIMAQIGCYVPASSANMMIYDQIYTRIGASDDLISGQSTFMVEMNEASNAILNATPNSLILFDEIGRGTATYDGMAIAGAMLEYLSINNQATLLFSTHYHELVALSNQYDNIKNYHASVIENQKEISFTYKIKPGSIDKSYGIHVAKLASLPNSIIKRAYQLLDSYQSEKPANEGNSINEERQLSYQKEDHYDDIIKDIEDCDINNLSPMQALNYLVDIKQKIKDLHDE